LSRGVSAGAMIAAGFLVGAQPLHLFRHLALADHRGTAYVEEAVVDRRRHRSPRLAMRPMFAPSGVSIGQMRP
jgi:hypothetical protein